MSEEFTARARWGWWRPDGTWGDLSRDLLETAGYKEVPCLVTLPDGSVRRVVEEGSE